MKDQSRSSGKPRRDGALRLLTELIGLGLDEDAWAPAAALVLTLDEDAAADREAIAA